MKAKSWSVVILLLLVGLPLLGVKRDTKMILDEIEKLSQLIAQMEKKLMLATADIAELNKKVDILSTRVSAMAGNQADFSQSKESIIFNLQAFKEDLNEIKTRLTQLSSRLSAPASSPTSSPSTSGEPAKPIGTPANGSPENVNLYYTAYSDYIKENYDLAIEGFRQYLGAYPSSGLADNAQYWIGECYYAKKKYQDAITTFSEVIVRYKDGDKVPAAYLKKGYALIEIGKQSEGITVLKELISRFPFSDETTLARQKLKEITE